MKCFIMRGLPGSGKSTLAKQIANNYNAVIVSTDDYWVRPDGYYDFNASRLKEAHDWCFMLFRVNIQLNVNVVVDNTNIRHQDYKRYVDYAESNKYSVLLAYPKTEWAWDVDECFKRNTHKVPLETIQKMKDRFEE